VTAIGLLEAGEIASLAHWWMLTATGAGPGSCCGCGGSTAVWRVPVAVQYGASQFGRTRVRAKWFAVLARP
jgi:hypothetical protein